VVEEEIPCDQAAVLASGWRSPGTHTTHLDEWTVDDLFQTYPHRFRGTDYSVSRQWTVVANLSHDIHHGGNRHDARDARHRSARVTSAGRHIITPALASPRVLEARCETEMAEDELEDGETDLHFACALGFHNSRITVRSAAPP